MNIVYKLLLRDTDELTFNINLMLTETESVLFATNEQIFLSCLFYIFFSRIFSSFLKRSKIFAGPKQEIR